MKKTLTVNFNNIVFNIDDDAYEMLQIYLSEIARHFDSDDEKKEIMTDIEARIAELFTEKLQKSKNVVTLEDVQEIIEIMGKPSQFTDGDEGEETSKGEKKQQKSRRFYRDPENAILGGVAGGIAAYFGWDVTLIRILLVLLVFIGFGVVIPIYIVVWLVAPPAVTASQRLEMQGEDVTVENIKTEMNNVKSYIESDKFKQSANSVGDKLLDIIRWCFKILFGFIGAVLGFVGLVLVAALLFALFFLIFDPTAFNGFAPDVLFNGLIITPEKAALLIISLILVIGCPIFLLVYWGIRMASGRHETSKTASWVVFILWLAGLFMFYSIGPNALINLNNQNGKDWSLVWSDKDAPLQDEIRDCAPFHSIDISGNIELIVKQDSVQKVEVSTAKEYLPKVITKVEAGVLRIYADGVFFNSKIKVFISADSLKSLVASGACRIKTESTLVLPELSLSLQGAGQADLDVKVAGLFTIDLSGASKANLNGSSQILKLEASGASKLEAEDLIAQQANISISGASKANIYSTESIDVEASGASHVNCKGNPKIVKKSDSGGSSIDIE